MNASIALIMAAEDIVRDTVGNARKSSTLNVRRNGEDLSVMRLQVIRWAAYRVCSGKTPLPWANPRRQVFGWRRVGFSFCKGHIIGYEAYPAEHGS
jgi:hypothetical protein